MTEHNDSWDRLLDLFHSAADRPVTEREAFLRAQGASEKTVVEVLELLDRHDRDTGRIDQPPQLPDLGEGDRRPEIDGLELLEELGTGGMGTVYRARRTEDFLPDVAVKVIRAGLDGPEILQRFEDERRILAALDHPNICRLLDGGLTADGRPYFVTEMVQEALPLHEYCVKHDLDLRDTLRLFADACRAVHHAHSRLVVHRDLKPSNLLVSSGGTVKLADFGIARVLASGPEDAELDEATRTELRRLTPEYAAPEQIRGEPISTAVDVYSLGVTLYRLLTGTLPHPRNGRSSAALSHAICTEEPSRPSTRVTGAGSNGTDTPTGPAPSLVGRADRRALRGDLDNIVLAALRKDPTRRTPSVLALLEDIEAYLDGRPVRARAPTAAYLMGKFVRRHPFGTAMTGAAALLLILSGVLIVRQSRIANVERDRARTEAERSQRVTEAMSQLFELGDPRRNSDVAEMTLAEFTDLAASKALAGLDEDPVTRARVAVSLGRWQVSMYRYAQAAELLDGAIPPLRTTSASQNELAEALHWSAAAHQNLGDTDLALERIEEAIELRRALHGGGDPSVAESLDRRGRIQGALNRLDEAASSFRSALDGLGAGIGPPTVEMADTLAMLGVTQYRQADYGGAAKSMQEALRIYRDLVDPNDWRVGRESGNLGAVLYALGDFRGALAAQQEALRVRSALFESDHPEIALTLSQIGNLERLLGHHGDAIATLDRSRDLRIQRLGAEHPAVALSDLFLGDALAIIGDFARGREILEEAHRIHLANFPEDHPRVVNSLGKIGALELLAGDAERSIPWLRRAIDQHSEVNGAVDLRLAANRTLLGRALLVLDRLDEAQTEAEAARAAYAELDAADGLFAADAELLAGDLQHRSGDLDGARATYERGLEMRRSSLPAGHWRIVEAEARLAELDVAIQPGAPALRTRLTQLGDALARSTFAGHPSVRRIRAVLRTEGGGNVER